jgi:hypothetical protein
MSASERPASATEAGPSTKIAAAKQVASVVESSGTDGSSAPLTLAALSAALRDYGIAQANDNTDAWWKSCADRAIEYLADLGQPFSADHVAELVPAPDHPCRWGARFHAAVRAGVVVLSARPSRHRGVQRVYVGGAR